MHPRLLPLVLFLPCFSLLSVTVHSHSQPSSPSNIQFSFFPSSPATLHSIQTLLTRCCRDAKLISHNHFTLNQLNVLTLPPVQYRILRSLLSQAPLPKRHIVSSPLPKPSLQRLLRQSSSQPKPGSRPDPDYEDFYNQYHTLDDLQTKWQQLAESYPALSLSEIGLSVEDRSIFLLKIGTTDPNNPKRIFINALQHAREWITASAATYVAEKLAINTLSNPPSQDAQLQALLRRVQVFIVPVVNPDGYAYSHTEGDQEDENLRPRLWRKNRRPYAGTCPPSKDEFDEGPAPGGVDLNRNWGKDFGGPLATSTDICHILYIGPSAFSEPETKALSQLLIDTEGILAHIDFHSFGQVILGPWASSAETPSRACEYDFVGKQMERSMIASSGKQYDYGRGQNFRDQQFAASGTMTDWVHQMFPKTLSYAVELRPTPVLGTTGFELPEDQILPTSREAFAAVKTLLRYGNDSDAFLNRFPNGAKCRQTAVVTSVPEEEGSSKGGLIAGAVVGVVIAAFVLAICLIVFRIKRRRSREKQLEEINVLQIENGSKEGGSLGSVCAVVKVPRTFIQPLTVEVQEPSSIESGNTGQIQYEVLSTVSNDCITPIGDDESPSVWYNMEGESSYGNTVLLDAQNPFFPDHGTPSAPRRSHS